MKRRLIVVAIVQRPDGRYLLCRMPVDRGVFPGQWGLPGGGVEEGELIEDALRRELREELQIEIRRAQPVYFKGYQGQKLRPNGDLETMYMVFLIYRCMADDVNPVLNEEFDACAWVAAEDLDHIDLNESTRETLRQVGILP